MLSRIFSNKQNPNHLILSSWIFISVPLNPTKGRTKKFLEQLKKVLKPKGTVLYNAHYQQKNVDEYKTFRKKTDAIFTKIEAVFSYPLNRVLQMSG
jgi:hypothetical protein